MLAHRPVIAFVPTTDKARARSFYEGVLGLKFVAEDPFAVVMESRGTMIRIVEVGEYTPNPFTILGWMVEDIGSEVELLWERGVVFEAYPGMNQDSQGIWTSPSGPRIAWFKDADGNVLSLSQHE